MAEWLGRGSRMGEELAVLVSAAGSALVTAMVTDGWEGIRVRFARLLGRGRAKEAEAAEERLEESRQALTGLSGAALERAKTELEIAWRTRLSELLDHDPGAERELRLLAAEAQALAAGSAGPIVQHAAAFDQAQQAVQGHGVQNVTFGGQGGRDVGPR
jgi:hypothetical protein